MGDNPKYNTVGHNGMETIEINYSQYLRGPESVLIT